MEVVVTAPQLSSHADISLFKKRKMRGILNLFSKSDNIEKQNSFQNLNTAQNLAQLEKWSVPMA